MVVVGVAAALMVWAPRNPAPVFRIRVTTAAGQNQLWAASSLTGTMVGTSQYVSSATFYCPAVTVKASLTGTPA